MFQRVFRKNKLEFFVPMKAKVADFHLSRRRLLNLFQGYRTARAGSASVSITS